MYKGGDNTPEKCETTCRDASYMYFGLQTGTECFCGSTLAHQEKKAESDCDIKCSGDNSKICGGSLRQSLFKIHYPNGKTYDVFILSDISDRARTKTTIRAFRLEM